MITNSDREKCPRCALWVRCDLPEGISEYVSTVINQRDTGGRNDPFHLVLLTEEFPCMKPLHIFSVM